MEESLTVKDWNPEEQPREKALNYGIGSLTKPELLSIIMRTGQQGIPVTQVCAELLQACGNSFVALSRMDRKEIMRQKGIGKVKALEIEAVMEIGRRMGRESFGDLPKITGAKDVFNLMRDQIGYLPHEEIHVLLLNRANRVTGTKRITQGSAVASIYDTKMILKEALLAGAQGIIMCHNHPSGNLIPSASDDRITRSLQKGCQAIELNLLDHVIVTSEGYYSYQDRGQLG